MPGCRVLWYSLSCMAMRALQFAYSVAKRYVAVELKSTPYFFDTTRSQQVAPWIKALDRFGSKIFKHLQTSHSHEKHDIL